ITMSAVATYGAEPQALTGLSKLNYFFGSNGTGKTTISRVIADASAFPGCSVVWLGGVALQPMVYNRDFVEENFNQSVELKGIFTLGKEQVDTTAKIAAVKAEVDGLKGRIQSLTQT